ncbi:DUF2332 domain-containing protein [Corticicoccus populi]|uniref:DUF2332 domain-containing protein n=1 Tax=Corticicoccus populi TaxID=1812821 RepID=A0ABW5WVE7_9STAP
MSQNFINFADNECKGSSRLYEQLSLHIAKTPCLLNLCRNISRNQPVPNLFFAAVHYLLLKGYDDRLSEMYHEKDIDFNSLFDAFEEFCLEHQQALIQVMNQKRVQTNEVRRTAYLYPLFSMISQKNDAPISLIEIGTSAGLNLCADQYRYVYEGVEGTFGNSTSELEIHSKIIGEMTHDLNHIPDIRDRIGIDLNVMDLNTDDDYLWLKALIWPEHHQRREMLKAAKEIVTAENVELIEGDAVSILDSTVQNINTENTLCIFHTHVANQMSEDQKEELLKAVDLIADGRTVYHIYNNIFDKKLRMDEYTGGRKNSYLIGETDGHGRWFEWKIQQFI